MEAKKRRNPPMTPEERNRVVELYNSGHTLLEIGNLLGRDKSTISKQLKAVREENPEAVRKPEQHKRPKKSSEPKDALISMPEPENPPEETPETSSAYSENKPVKRKSSPPDYLQLDIAGYRTYLREMSGFRGQSITHYLRQLIKADMQKNQELYDELEKLRLR